MNLTNCLWMIIVVMLTCPSSCKAHVDDDASSSSRYTILLAPFLLFLLIVFLEMRRPQEPGLLHIEAVSYN